ncbi:MAG: site-2 protease family protein [Candidatus Aenigmarchaeota archaeon]|nr:site-2 protease family protein [Candidatus Aenigmarchaeota archaeon]
MLNIYLLSIVVFFGILAILIYLDRKNIEFKYVLLMRRTKKGLKLLDRIARFRKFWKIIGIIAIAVCFILVADSLFSLSLRSWQIITGEVKEGFGGVVFPSPTPETVVGTGYILIPFWFWIIIIPTILFPHEIAHGIMSRVERIRVKSAGLLLLLIIPGAFVEPDEKKLKKAKLLSKLKIFAAGSFANIAFAFFLFNPFLKAGIIPDVVWPALVPNHAQLEVFVVNVTENSPADKAGLKNGTVITEINQMPTEINYVDLITGQYLSKHLKGVKPGDEIEVVANNSRYIITAGEIVVNENQTRPYLGIVTTIKIRGNTQLFNFFMNLFFWMWLLNYAVAVFNILPIYPLDGGLMLQAIAERVSKKYNKEIVGAITIVTICLVLFTIFGPSIIAGLQSFLSQSS